jgi:hypothetical protein
MSADRAADPADAVLVGPGRVRLYDLPYSSDFSPGRGGFLQLLGTPLSPCHRYHPAGGAQRIGLLRQVLLSSLQAHKLDLRILISRLRHVRCRYSLVTRDHPFDGLVGRLQGLGLPPPCYPSYGAPTLTPVGLSPTECASLRWTHRPAQRSFTLRPACSPSPLQDPLHRRLQSFRCLHDCSDCYRLQRKLPGGICTH